MIEQFRFDSDALPPHEAFDAYRRLYGLGSDVERGERPFSARVWAIRLDGLLLYERRLDGVVHSRARRAGQDQFDHFALHLVLAGTLEGSAQSRFERAGPGDLVLADALRASCTEAKELHVLTASVPRSTIAAACGPVDQLHGRIVSAPRTHLLGDVMQSTVRNADSFEGGALPNLRRAFQELLFATLADLTSAAPTMLRVDVARREAAERYIRNHLGERDLDAAAVAAGIGASRSSLYRLFEPDGGVAQFIMTRRLAAVRDALEQGSRQPLAVLAEMFGFTDESHLNRRFKQAYGQPAGAYRRTVLQAGVDGLDAAMRRWPGWMIEIS